MPPFHVLSRLSAAVLALFAGTVHASRQGAFDPIDDTFGGFLDQPDIANVSAWHDDESLVVDIRFHYPVTPPDDELNLGLVGSLEIDADQDPQTGTVSFLNVCPQERTTGFEFFVTLFGYEPDDPAVPGIGTAPVLDANFDAIAPAIVTFEPTWVRIRLPLLVLPRPDVDVALALGTPGEPTDCAPDGGVERAVDRRFEDGFEPRYSNDVDRVFASGFE